METALSEDSSEKPPSFSVKNKSRIFVRRLCKENLFHQGHYYTLYYI